MEQKCEANVERFCTTIRIGSCCLSLFFSGRLDVSILPAEAKGLPILILLMLICSTPEY